MLRVSSGGAPGPTSTNPGAWSEMARTSLNFMSYNSTGLNAVKAEWIRNTMQSCKIDFMNIQEHFKKSKTIESYFKSTFPSNDTYVKAGVRSEGQNSGRAKGGLAQLSAKAVGVRKERVSTSSWRLQAQILHCTGGYRLLWINAYFPTDPQVQNYDETELLEVLAEVERIMDSTAYDDCCLGGDLNYDTRRDTGFVRAVTSFLDRVGLISVWEKFPIDFTHVHTDQKSFSILDNFFVNRNLLNNIEDAGPVHCGSNLSRHSPIMMKMKLSTLLLPKSAAAAPPRPRRPAWYKASEQEKHIYTNMLDDKIRSLIRPAALSCNNVTCTCPKHTLDRDSYVLDLMSLAIETSHQVIPLSRGSAKSEDKSEKSSCALPGWKEMVAPQKNDSLFWHAVWISAGKPNSGELFNVMKHARSKYHYAVRRAERSVAALRAASLKEAAASGDMALIAELKRNLGKPKGEQEVPESLEGEVTEDGILTKFRDLYSELYNSAGTEDEVGKIKLELESLVTSKCSNSENEVSKITGEAVKKACARMKPGKCDVTEAYTSDLFLNAPDSLFEELAAVFRSFLVHGTVSLQILSCAFLPLFKGGHKKPDQFTSYRAIAGASQLLKLWEYTVLNLWGGNLSTDSLQFGFQRGLSTAHCSWLVMEVCGYFLRRKSEVCIALMDCSMAFDKCLFSKLFSKLSTKLPAIVVRALLWVYCEQEGCVKLAGRRSSTFKLSNGTRQGSVLSPALWCVYLEDLLTELRNLKLGCYIGGVWMGVCAYADDLLCMAPNRNVLQQMVAVCQRYGRENNLVFSTDPNPSKSKTKCMLVCGRDRVQEYPDPIKLEGYDLPWVETALHLGHTLHQNGKMDQDAKIRRAIFIDRSVEVREKLSFAEPSEVLRALTVYCCDAYGAMLWPLASHSAQMYFRAWNTAVKLTHNLPRSTFTYLVEDYFAGRETSLRNQVISRYPGFLQSLLQSPCPEVRVLCRVAAADPDSTTRANINYLQEMTGYSPRHYSSTVIKAAIPCAVVPSEQQWRLGLLSSLLSLRSEKHQSCEDTTRVEAMLASLCST